MLPATQRYVARWNNVMLPAETMLCCPQHNVMLPAETIEIKEKSFQFDATHPVVYTDLHK
jgi:hypothetical protein